MGKRGGDGEEREKCSPSVDYILVCKYINFIIKKKYNRFDRWFLAIIPYRQSNLTHLQYKKTFFQQAAPYQ